ncbi:hypothetical protein VC83_00299 [Pseudogymnoascus destructans]|uniref:2EXR domain-containing protein n=2 Tax=Pseudogymnoascus destructans TaxID=655981 RepID=L8FX05_PSED2|nr:uncharacterized protein VC83_00299 [Pseudogymnoascus destructans]ELR04246.1 hypothetical protein GMDG_06654 [Pseudogymnoascus destructans 20631-21]OAF63337.1 hypothetical protein VC83_00299 [Pseudogymnoascus destructans]
MKGLELLAKARWSETASTPDTSGLATFTPFPRLPTELRTAIWRASLPCDLHIAEVRICNKSIAPHLPAHTIFSVNRESRAEAFRVLLNALPPYRLPADPQQDIIFLDPGNWNDLSHMSVGKAPIRAAVCDIDRAHRFIATAMVDTDGGRFDSLPVDMRFYSPYGHNNLPAGPRDFQVRPLRMDFVCVARKVGTGRRGLGGGFYLNSADGEDGVVGLGGRKDQGSKKPALRIVYVL